MMANPKRGEIEIILAEKKFNGRITLDVVQRIEMGLDLGVVEIAQQLSQGKLKMNEISFILHPIIKAGGNDVSEKEVAELCWKNGLSNTLAIIAQVVTSILDPSGEEGNEKQAAQSL